MLVVVLMLAMLFLSAGPAAATRTVDCSFSDENLTFDAGTTVSHGFGESFARGTGKLEIRAKAAPDDLRKVEFELEHLAQRWFYGNDLKLRLYVLNVSQMVGAEEKTLTIRGSAKCQAD
jgi:hypothetical protein